MQRAFVDWWSFRTQSDPLEVLDRVVRLFRKFANRSPHVVARQTGWQHFHASSAIRMGNVAIGLVAYGGKSQRGWTYVGIPGKGCELIQDWALAESECSVLEDYELRRVDLALDSDPLLFGFDATEQAHRQGNFRSSTGGPSPCAEVLTGSEGRRTIGIGSRSSQLFFRCYERGAMFRHEIESKPRSKALPTNILQDRDGYLETLNPFLGRLLGYAAPTWDKQTSCNTWGDNAQVRRRELSAPASQVAVGPPKMIQPPEKCKPVAKRRWAPVRQDYESGVMPLKDVARKHGLSPSALSNKASRSQWFKPERDVKKRVDRLLRDAALAARPDLTNVLGDTIPYLRPGEFAASSERIASLTRLTADVVLAHRADIRDLQAVAAAQLAELRAFTHSIERLSQSCDQLQTSCFISAEQAREAHGHLQAASRFKERVAALASLVGTFGRLQELERQAFGLKDGQLDEEGEGINGIMVQFVDSPSSQS